MKKFKTNKIIRKKLTSYDQNKNYKEKWIKFVFLDYHLLYYLKFMNLVRDFIRTCYGISIDGVNNIHIKVWLGQKGFHGQLLCKTEFLQKKYS